jgi:hypothetical protein
MINHNYPYTFRNCNTILESPTTLSRMAIYNYSFSHRNNIDFKIITSSKIIRICFYGNIIDPNTVWLDYYKLTEECQKV